MELNVAHATMNADVMIGKYHKLQLKKPRYQHFMSIDILNLPTDTSAASNHKSDHHQQLCPSCYEEHRPLQTRCTCHLDHRQP